MVAAPEVAMRDNPDENRFEANLGDGSIAIAAYLLEPGKIIFTHTEVPPEHEGKGVGSALIRFALAAARERGPRLCRFAPSSPPT
jgi:predicted GNAT family acetyltransferase